MEIKTLPETTRRPDILTLPNPNLVRKAAEADFARSIADYVSGQTAAKAEMLKTNPVTAPFLPTGYDRDSYLATLPAVVSEEVQRWRREEETGTARPEDRDQLGNLVLNAVGSLHASEGLAALDEINGINRSDNPESPIETEEMQNFLRGIAKKTGADFDSVQVELDRMLNGGGYAYFMTYLENFSGTPEIRQFIERAVTERLSDGNLAVKKLGVYWKVFQTLKEFGLNFDELGDLLSIPSSDTSDQKLEEFLSTMTAGGEDAHFTTLAVRAREQGFADSMRPHDEIQKDIQEITSLFPILAAAGDRVLVSTFTGPGTDPRPVAISYRNTSGERIFLQNVNGLLNRTAFRKGFGHETSHNVQGVIKEIARENGYYGDRDREPREENGIDETFAELYEKQVGLMDGQAEQNREIKQSPQARQAQETFELLRRRQYIIKALVNRRVQKELASIQTRLDSGSLRENEVGGALHDADTNVATELVRWCTLGISVDDSTLTTQELYNPLFPYDGRVYEMGILAETSHALEEVGQTAGQSSAPELFTALLTKEFKDLWIKNPDAQSILLNIFLQTGREDFSIEELPALANIPIEKAHVELARAGIPGYSTEEELQ